MTKVLHRATAFALILALLSGFTLAQLWSLEPLRLGTIQSIPNSQVEATALAFYQGINAYLENGSGRELRRLLHPDFVSHQPGGPTSGNVDSLLQQFDSIKRHFPGLRIEPRITPVGSTAVSVSLAWDPMAPFDIAGIEIEPADLIGRLDLLRIERGLIAERWSSAVLVARLDAFPALSIELPFALQTMVARVRPIPLQGDYEPTFSQQGHLLLIDLSGDAFLEVIGPASTPAMIWKRHQGRIADPAPVTAGMRVKLGQMDAIYLPAGAIFRIWDAGDQDAELIALEFGPPISGGIHGNGPLLTDLRTTLWSGVELAEVSDRLTLSFGRVELLPESTITSPNVSGIELACITSGTITMTGSHGEARVRAASGLRSQLVEGHAVLSAGDVSAASPGSRISYHATGTHSSTAWFFSLVAEPDQPRAEATGTPAGPTVAPTSPPPRNIS